MTAIQAAARPAAVPEKPVLDDQLDQLPPEGSRGRGLDRDRVRRSGPDGDCEPLARLGLEEFATERSDGVCMHAQPTFAQAGTVDAVQRELLHDGFVRRYSTRTDVDGLPVGEAAFLVCTLWLADNLALLGRIGEARRLFERVLDLRNDLGLLSEEYDPAARRLVGNFPQALSPVGLVNTAHNLATTAAERRRRS